jgi:hypothetical protein
VPEVVTGKLLADPDSREAATLKLHPHRTSTVCAERKRERMSDPAWLRERQFGSLTAQTAHVLCCQHSTIVSRSGWMR